MGLEGFCDRWMSWEGEVGWGMLRCEVIGLCRMIYLDVVLWGGIVDEYGVEVGEVRWCCFGFRGVVDGLSIVGSMGGFLDGGICR